MIFFDERIIVLRRTTAMRIEDVLQIATRAEQLLRLTVGREFSIHPDDGGGFVPTVTVEEQGPGQFVATARLSPEGKFRAIGFTQHESLKALAFEILKLVNKMRASRQETAVACRDFSARMRLMAASRREKIASANIATCGGDREKSLGSLAVNLGYEDIEIGAHRVANDGAWKATAQGRSLYCEAHSDTSFNDAMLALASMIVAESMRECEHCETNAMRSDHKAMAYGFLADHFAAEAANIAIAIREATRG